MAKREHKDAPVDLQSAIEQVSTLAADVAAKKAESQARQTEFESADSAANDAEVKLKEAEESLLKAARAHKPEKPSE